jgi:hypothetical protein
VVSEHQLDLAEGISYLASGLKGFASVGYSGPNDYPNTWANIYTNPVTLANAYGVLGPCGALDLALDAILGPDPLPCADQTGPLPGSSSTSGSSAGSSGSSAGSSGSLASPSSGIGGLSQLLDPLTGGDQ